MFRLPFLRCANWVTPFVTGSRHAHHALPILLWYQNCRRFGAVTDFDLFIINRKRLVFLHKNNHSLLSLRSHIWHANIGPIAIVLNRNLNTGFTLTRHRSVGGNDLLIPNRMTVLSHCLYADLLHIKHWRLLVGCTTRLQDTSSHFIPSDGNSNQVLLSAT